MARVPLMPTSQSASVRQRAASASGCMSASLRRCVNPSRIAPRRHRLQPQALDRLLGFGVLRDQAENQLAFAPGVAGVDQVGDVLALDQLVEDLQARFGLVDRVQREVRRNHRQVREGPFAALDVVFFGHRDFEQMADGRREDVFVGFEVLIVLGEAAERLRDIVRDGRLLGNDERFCHGLWVSQEGVRTHGCVQFEECSLWRRRLFSRTRTANIRVAWPSSGQ